MPPQTCLIAESSGYRDHSFESNDPYLFWTEIGRAHV